MSKPKSPRERPASYWYSPTDYRLEHKGGALSVRARCAGQPLSSEGWDLSDMPMPSPDLPQVDYSHFYAPMAPGHKPNAMTVPPGYRLVLTLDGRVEAWARWKPLGRGDMRGMCSLCRDHYQATRRDVEGSE